MLLPTIQRVSNLMSQVCFCIECPELALQGLPLTLNDIDLLLQLSEQIFKLLKCVQNLYKLFHRF